MSDQPTEIGAEFPLRPGGDGDPQRVLRSLVGARPSVPVGSGREALRLLLRDAAARGRTTVAFAAYLCPAVLEALDPSQEVRFLATGPRLAPTPAALRSLSMSRGADETVLVAAPYFGAAYRQEIVDALEGVWAAGVEIIEDRSHSLFSDAAQLVTARGFASLRKWSGLADGGVAFGTAVDNLSTDLPSGGEAFDLRREGMEAKGRWLDDGEGDKESFIDLITRGEAALSKVAGVRPMTTASLSELAGWDIGAIRSARQANAHQLLKGLRRIPGIEPMLQFGADETPLGMPVLCDARDDVRRGLTAQGIYCPIHWELPAQVTAAEFPYEHSVQARILTLVCDQRYGSDDMEHILDALRRVV